MLEVRHDVAPGQWADDTSMALPLADSIRSVVPRSGVSEELHEEQELLSQRRPEGVRCRGSIGLMHSAGFPPHCSVCRASYFEA